ncbi:MAG: alpha/beta fold hydrolase [Acetobacter sp.]|nr:alpha/beta fold hydrolase [Acetobacter sp.]
MLLNVIEQTPEPSALCNDTPLVFLHGLFGRARNFGFVQRRLATTHRTLALDLRNHGESPHGPMSYPIMANDVYETLRHYTTESCTLLGHSMGGKTAMMLALLHPDIVKSLIIVDIAPGRGGFSSLDLPPKLETVVFPPKLDLHEANTLLQSVIPDNAVRQLMIQNIHLGDNPGWSIGLDDILTALPLIMDWPSIPENTCYTGPTLFIKGENSPYIHPDNYPIMQRLFPNYTLKSIAGAGHWVHADAPKYFLACVERFLATQT